MADCSFVKEPVEKHLGGVGSVREEEDKVEVVAASAAGGFIVEL